MTTTLLPALRSCSRLTGVSLLASSSRISFAHRSQRYSSTTSTTKDPSHPHLHYHRTPSYTALSFLPNPPSSKSRTVIGYLPVDNPTLQDFVEEPAFSKVLHDAIRSGLETGKAQSITFEAETRPVDGYIHITDERAIPPAGRIGETEDLIGSVYVQSGKIIPSTYDPFPTYRLVTPNGVCTLPKGLDEHLIEVLKKIDAEERAAVAS